MKTSIVIPSYNHWDLTDQLLHDLLMVSTKPVEIVVVNNGSQEPVPESILQLTTVRIIDLAENVGFLLACNLGVKMAQGDLIHLISNDVRVYKDIVKFVEGLLEGNMGQIASGRVLDYDTGWNTFKGKTFPYAEGWYLSCMKRTWDDIGGFDTRYMPYDFEDVDFSTAAIAKHYQLYQMPPGYLAHIGAQTIGYNPEREAITRQHQELFRQKWLLEN